MLLSDTTLPDRVGAAVHHNPYLNGRRLSVLPDSGRVILEGVVNSYYHKQMAQEALRRIDGVRSIDNRLQVVTTYRRGTL